MKLALRELRRRPTRFAVLSIAMWLLAVLMLFLGGLLDGLNLGSTGVLRAQQADLVVFSDGSRASMIRSRIDPTTRSTVEAVPGVKSVTGLGVVLVGAEVPGETELADTVVVGYEVGSRQVPAPPAPGEAYADRSLAGVGVSIGDRLGVGPNRVPLVVVGWVDDANFLGQGGLWVESGTWRNVLDLSRPDSRLADGSFQVLAVEVADRFDVQDVAVSIDAATEGGTQSITKAEAIQALPGIKEQQKTMTQVIGVTAVVAGVVAALFFSLVTLERSRLYAVLKALGASTSQIFAGLLAQALLVTTVSFAVAGLVAFGFGVLIPPGTLPFRLETSRVVATYLILLFVSAGGSAVSLRRVTRIEPASAIG